MVYVLSVSQPQVRIPESISRIWMKVCIQISLYSDSCIQVSSKKEAIYNVFVYARGSWVVYWYYIEKSSYYKTFATILIG